MKRGKVRLTGKSRGSTTRELQVPNFHAMANPCNSCFFRRFQRCARASKPDRAQVYSRWGDGTRHRSEPVIESGSTDNITCVMHKDITIGQRPSRRTRLVSVMFDRKVNSGQSACQYRRDAHASRLNFGEHVCELRICKLGKTGL